MESRKVMIVYEFQRVIQRDRVEGRRAWEVKSARRMLEVKAFIVKFSPSTRRLVDMWRVHPCAQRGVVKVVEDE